MNVHLIMNQIRMQSSILLDFEKSGKVFIIGGLCDTETGVVSFFDNNDTR